jgi:hypothetical protein
VPGVSGMGPIHRNLLEWGPVDCKLRRLPRGSVNLLWYVGDVAAHGRIYRPATLLGESCVPTFEVALFRYPPALDGLVPNGYAHDHRRGCWVEDTR